jgi:hypothetical protein
VQRITDAARICSHPALPHGKIPACCFLKREGLLKIDRRRADTGTQETGAGSRHTRASMSLGKKDRIRFGSRHLPFGSWRCGLFSGNSPVSPHMRSRHDSEREKGCAGIAGEQVSRSMTFQQIWLDLPTRTNGEKHSCSQLMKSNNTRTIVGMSMIGFEISRFLRNSLPAGFSVASLGEGYFRRSLFRA